MITSFEKPLCLIWLNASHLIFKIPRKCNPFFCFLYLFAVFRLKIQAVSLHMKLYLMWCSIKYGCILTNLFIQWGASFWRAKQTWICALNSGKQNIRLSLVSSNHYFLWFLVCIYAIVRNRFSFHVFEILHACITLGTTYATDNVEI